jgi:hypothetical protein
MLGGVLRSRRNNFKHENYNYSRTIFINIGDQNCNVKMYFPLGFKNNYSNNILTRNLWFH